MINFIFNQCEHTLQKGRNTFGRGADVGSFADRRFHQESHRNGAKALLQDLHELRFEESHRRGQMQEMQEK
jgi:hypothetical protein